jgi:hypothetical protein
VRHLNDTLTIRYDHVHEDIQQLSKYMNMSEIDVVSHIQTHAHKLTVNESEYVNLLVNPDDLFR